MHQLLTGDIANIVWIFTKTNKQNDPRNYGRMLKRKHHIQRKFEFKRQDVESGSHLVRKFEKHRNNIVWNIVEQLLMPVSRNMWSTRNHVRSYRFSNYRNLKSPFSRTYSIRSISVNPRATPTAGRAVRLQG